MTKIKILVFSGYGLNCEEETKFAFEKAGGFAEIIHINDLIVSPAKIDNYQIFAFPGGFSYGDDTGSGNAYANRLKNHLWEKIEKVVKKDSLVIGICNGFQILVNLGLVPAINNHYGERQVALLPNSNARYTTRWVDLKIESSRSPWLKDLKDLSVPIAHGEGRFYTDEATLQTLKAKGMVALKYVKGEICEFQDLEANPNGSVEDIAGVIDETGRILGMMPHPERAMFFTQLPHWTYLKEVYKKQNKELPDDGPGLQIFKNAVNYFK